MIRPTSMARLNRKSRSAPRRVGASVAVSVLLILAGAACGGGTVKTATSAGTTTVVVSPPSTPSAPSSRSAQERSQLKALAQAVNGSLIKSSCAPHGKGRFLCHALVRLRAGKGKRSCNVYAVDEHGFVLQRQRASCTKTQL